MKPKDENELKEENKGLQRDLLEMVDEDFESFEDTAATNNLNQSQGKLNEPSVEGNYSNLIFLEKEFNFENLGKELDIENQKENQVKFFLFILFFFLNYLLFIYYFFLL